MNEVVTPETGFRRVECTLDRARSVSGNLVVSFRVSVQTSGSRAFTQADVGRSVGLDEGESRN